MDSLTRDRTKFYRSDRISLPHKGEKVGSIPIVATHCGVEKSGPSRQSHKGVGGSNPPTATKILIFQWFIYNFSKVSYIYIKRLIWKKKD
jgi:hypothetical protein